MKKEYLFYNEYEEFYKMVKNSWAFAQFCENAFGKDFSQDGFSDMRQIDRILEKIPKDKGEYHILDIGCGNGKVLGYLQQKLPAYIYGFDYSKQAIAYARELFKEKSEFQNAAIGEIEYPTEKFDVIISMDTMYFAEDMGLFVKQIKNWLKEDGVFLVGYQEGDVVPKTQDASTTKLADALKQNTMPYFFEDITEESYEILKRKYDTAMELKEDFIREGNEQWFHMLIGQTRYADCELAEFKKKMSRYIYVVKKNEI